MAGKANPGPAPVAQDRGPIGDARQRVLSAVADAADPGVTVAEVEELVDVGMIDPDAVHLPGIYVHRIVLNPHPEKRIDVLMLREEGR